jgi:hypothetical protein
VRTDVNIARALVAGLRGEIEGIDIVRALGGGLRTRGDPASCLCSEPRLLASGQRSPL